MFSYRRNFGSFLVSDPRCLLSRLNFPLNVHSPIEKKWHLKNTKSVRSSSTSESPKCDRANRLTLPAHGRSGDAELTSHKSDNFYLIPPPSRVSGHLRCTRCPLGDMNPEFNSARPGSAHCPQPRCPRSTLPPLLHPQPLPILQSQSARSHFDLVVPQSPSRPLSMVARKGDACA